MGSQDGADRAAGGNRAPGQPRARRRAQGYVAAVIGTLVALALRWALEGVLRDTAQFLLFYFSVMVAASIGGLRAGLLALALGSLAGMWYFTQGGQVGLQWDDDLARLAFFVVFGVVASAVCGGLVEARRRADERTRELASLTESLRRTDADLRRAQAVARTGNWRLALDEEEAGRLIWSDETYRMFGVAPGTPMTYRKFIAMVHPEDRAKLESAWQAALRREAPYDVEHRIVLPDGQVKWVRERAELDLGEDGRLLAGFGTVQDITEKKGTEEALAAAKASAEAARAAAEAASRAKDKFLAVLSHELRTPLTPVLATASVLEADASLPEAVRQDIAMVRRNVELEARLIDDLLDLTRIVRGKVELDRRRVKLCDVIDRAVEVCRPDIEARGLRFEHVCCTAGEGCTLEADAARLQQVFWNLLKNAAKFTGHGGRVSVGCRRDEANGGVVVEVKDDGQGIEPALLPRLFEPFEQGSSETTRQFGGLGLGLTIARGLVEQHGGRIEGHSDGPGRGATFRVWLPVTEAGASGAGDGDGGACRAPRRLPIVSAGTAGAADQPGAAARVDGASSAAAATTTTRPRPRPLRILLVEDHGDSARVVQRLLRADGHEVEAAGDVAAALKLAASGPPFDLLLSDLGLPDGNGHDLVRELRRRGINWPAVAVSGYGQEEDLKRSREAGFAIHLTKPVTYERLAEAIETAARSGAGSGTGVGATQTQPA